MRFKYKKITLFLTLEIMLIGFVTFSMCTPTLGGKSSKKKNNTKKETLAIEKVEDKAVVNEIQALIESYFKAKLSVDMSKLEKLVTNVDYIEQSKLVNEATWYVDEKNIECTVLKGYKKNEYRVYVKYDVQISTTETLIPGLNVLNVIQNEDGEYRVYNAELSKKQLAHNEKLDESEIVEGLSAEVSKELERVIQEDKAVLEFYEMLESSAEDGEEDEEQDTSGEAVKETPAVE